MEKAGKATELQLKTTFFQTNLTYSENMESSNFKDFSIHDNNLLKKVFLNNKFRYKRASHSFISHLCESEMQILTLFSRGKFDSSEKKYASKFRNNKLLSNLFNRINSRK